MENAISDLLVSNVPGLITGIITGLIILAIEYRTGWFIKQKRELKGSQNSLQNKSLSNLPLSLRNENRDWTLLAFQIPLFLLTFVMTFAIVGLPIC